jgi:hypothetical protein
MKKDLTTEFERQVLEIRSRLMGDELGVSQELSDVSLVFLRKMVFVSLWYNKLSNQDAQTDLWSTVFKLLSGDKKIRPLSTPHYYRMKFIPPQFTFTEIKATSALTKLRLDYITNKLPENFLQQLLLSFIINKPNVGLSISQSAQLPRNFSLHRIHLNSASEEVNLHRAKLTSMLYISSILEWAVERKLIKSTDIIRSTKESISAITSARMGSFPKEINAESDINKKLLSFSSTLEQRLLFIDSNIANSQKQSRKSI